MEELRKVNGGNTIWRREGKQRRDCCEEDALKINAFCDRALFIFSSLPECVPHLSFFLFSPLFFLLYIFYVYNQTKLLWGKN